MYQCGVELEALFEDHGVCSEVVSDFLRSGPFLV